MFSSELLLAAEDRLLERARTTTGPTVPLDTVEKITGRPDRDGRTLGDDQAAALAKVAVSGRVVDVLVGPAGAGKTTAMNALRRAWEQEHGSGSVVGLAPSAVAAQVLADDLGIATENVLVAGSLLVQERQGRHRYVRVAGPHVAEIVEDLAAFAADRVSPPKSLAADTRRRALGRGLIRRRARRHPRPALLGQRAVPHRRRTSLAR